MRAGRAVQISRADDIRPYTIVQFIILRYPFIVRISIGKSQLINPFNHITRLKHMQEKSRQVLLSGLKLFMNT